MKADLSKSSFQTGPVYARASLVKAYASGGELPKIHDEMGLAMGTVPQLERKGLLDLGACHGLLSVRAKKMGFSPVIGVEMQRDAIDIFEDHVNEPGVTLFQMKLDFRDAKTRDSLSAHLRKYCVTTILARRALPEMLSDTYGKKGKDPEVIREAGAAFSSFCFNSGVERLIVEGRAFSKRSVHPLPKIEAEISALGPGWRVAYRQKEVAILVPA